MTIDELARAAGMTVRNVRAHQTRGLLPAPTVEGRTGYYGPHHVTRLRLIKEMQSAGYNLGAIKNLLDAAPAGSENDVLEFERALLAPWSSEEPAVYEAAELIEMFGNPPMDVMQRAADLGFVVPLEDGRVEIPLPTMLRAGRQLHDMGIPLERSLTVLEELLGHVQGVSSSFVRLFLDEVWRPFEEAGQPAERWTGIREDLERLRPLASDVLLASFRKVMANAVEHAFGEEFEKRLAQSGEEAV